MKNIKLLFLFSLVILPTILFAQNKRKTDTIFYLIDTVNTPVKDRMISTEMIANFKFFYLHCECLKNKQEPTFYYDTAKTISKNIQSIKNIDFVSLPRLLKLSQEEDLFKVNHIAYFVEPFGKKYTIYQVKLFKEKTREPSDDSVVLPPVKKG